MKFTDRSDFDTGFSIVDIRNMDRNVAGGGSLAIDEINTLSELFTEWFLLDSSTEKTIGDFLKSESLDDCITEDEFMGVMTGDRYLDDGLCLLLSLKLPLTNNRIQYFSNGVRFKNSAAPVIKSSQIVQEKIKQQVGDNKVSKREALLQKKRDYRHNNHELILLRAKQYSDSHKEQSKQYYQNNLEYIKKRKRKYRQDNKQNISKYNKEYRQQNIEKLRQKDRDRNKNMTPEQREKKREKDRRSYQKRAAQIKEKLRESYAADPDAARQKRMDYYYKKKSEEKNAVISQLVTSLLQSKSL